MHKEIYNATIGGKDMSFNLSLILYNIFTAVMFIASLSFFIYMSMGSGKKNSVLQEHKKDVYWENRENGEPPTYETHS